MTAKARKSAAALSEAEKLERPGRYVGYAVRPATYTGTFRALCIAHRIRDRFKVDLCVGEIGVGAASVALRQFGLCNLMTGEADGDADVLTHCVAGAINQLRLTR